jgi:hypothetical protein
VVWSEIRSSKVVAPPVSIKARIEVVHGPPTVCPLRHMHGRRALGVRWAMIISLTAS